MARHWSGFVPQNQDIKQQWGLLEATSIEIEEDLRKLFREKIEAGEQSENEELYLVRVHRDN